MRTAKIERKTKETQIKLELNLDGTGKSKIKSPVNFLNHMLENFAKHSGYDLSIDAKGDVKVEDHHLVEDLGLCLGEAVDKALGDKKGIRRMGHAIVPMDESLATVALDLSGRPYSKISIFTEYEFEINRRRLVEELEEVLFKEERIKVLQKNFLVDESSLDFIARDKNGKIVLIEVKTKQIDDNALNYILGDFREALNVLKFDKMKEVSRNDLPKEVTEKDLQNIHGIILSSGTTHGFDSHFENLRVSNKLPFKIEIRDWRKILGNKLDPKLGDLTKENIPHFFESFAAKAKMNLHIQVKGDNDHHKVEAAFKALARAMHDATRVTGKGVSSTKGVI